MAAQRGATADRRKTILDRAGAESESESGTNEERGPLSDGNPQIPKDGGDTSEQVGGRFGSRNGRVEEIYLP